MIDPMRIFSYRVSLPETDVPAIRARWLTVADIYPNDNDVQMMPKSFLSRVRHASVALLCMASASCAWLNEGKKVEYPKDAEDRRMERIGSMAGENGLVLFGKKERAGSADGSGIGVNSYLWRATLDTLRFMPLQSADPFGGVIITDWYEDPNAESERFKVNAFITSKELRSDGVRVSLFRQIRQDDEWKDASASDSASADIEDRILVRAKRLRVGDQ